MIGFGLNIANRVMGGGGGGSAFDVDAQAFFDRVTTAGGTLSETEKNATNQLVLDMKTAGIWSSMKAIYPMVGASAAACAQNLKSSSFTGTFTSGWTFASTGVTPNGTSAYMDSFFNPSTNGMSSSNGHLSVYNRSNTTGTNKALIGVLGAVDEISINFDAQNVYAMFGNNPYPGYSQVDKRGFYSVSRDTATTVKNYHNGSVKINGDIVAFSAIPNAKILLGVQGTATGNRGNFTSNEQAFASIGDTLNSTQSANLYTAVQTFNQTLNRQVGAQIVSDADAQAYIDRVYTAGGTLTNTEANAVNQLTIDMKAAGIWTAMKAVYPMVGSSAAACAQNLKSSSFTGTFSSGWTFSSSGVKGNGSSTYMNTFLSPNGNISLNSGHLSYYTNENVKIGAFQIGVFGNNAITMLGARFDATRNYIGINTTGDVLNSETNNVNSFVCLSRISSTEFKYYKQDTTYQTITNNSFQLSNNNIYVGALNLDGGTAFLPDTARCAFASIGLGLTDTENSNLYTAVQAFQTTLSRQV